MQFLGRSGEGAPGVGVDPLVQVEADIGAQLTTDAGAGELRRQHAGVVHHQHIAGAQNGQQIADMAIHQGFAGAHHQHARGVARLCRMKCNALGRQVEVEIVNLHWAMSQRMA
jgi:hypothetical protein